MQPFFSIIVPVYNVAPYLRACLDSVLAQTFGDWECLCVDDGSTDESDAILDDYAKRDVRFRVIHQRNGGVSAARNRALDVARGAFVCFADGDDIAYPWWLATFAHFQRLSDADLVRVSFPRHQPYNPTLPTLEHISYSIFNGPKEVFEWGWPTFEREGYPVLYAIRRSLVEGLSFLRDVRLKEDVLFALSFLPKVTRVIQGDVITYWYRYRENSAIRRHPPYLESLVRIQHYVRIYNAQKPFHEACHADVRFAASWSILRELIAIIDDGQIKELPQILNTCIQQGGFTLSVFPLKWRLFLGGCIKGRTWPLQLAFYWLWFKRAIVRWMLSRQQTYTTNHNVSQKPPRQFQLFVEPTEYILDLIATVHESRGITCAFAYDRKTLASQGTTAFPVVERFSWVKRVGYLWRALKQHDVVSIHSYADPMSITVLFLNLFWRRQVRFEVDSAWREPHQWLARVAKRMWLGFWFTRPYVWGTSIGAQVHRDFFLKYGLPEARLSERPNVVNNARTARPQPSEPTAAFRFGYVGRLVRHKAVDVLIEAFREVVRRYPQASLTIVGDGPERDTLRTQAADLPQVIFTGALYGREKVVRQHQMDALCLVSLYEPWGLVVNEALAAGTPCIVSACCGCAEPLIRGPQAGVVVPDGDVAALIDAMVYLIEHPTEASAMGQRGAAFLSHEWNYARYARALDEDNEAASRWWRVAGG